MSPLQVSETFKLISYADDLKPEVRTLEEINLCIDECEKLALVSGVQLHCDPQSGKVKILPLGLWRDSLSQDDIPHSFIRLTDQLDCVGVKLTYNYFTTRKINNSLLVEKVSKLTNLWWSGRHMALVDRSHSINLKIFIKNLVYYSQYLP